MKIFNWAIFIFLCLVINVYSTEPEIKISSKKVEFLKLEGKTIFTDNVRMLQGKNYIFADRMVKDDKNKIIEAENNVITFYETLNGQTLKISGNKLHYDLLKEEIYLPERPYLVYTDSFTGSSGEIISDDITFYRSEGRMIFEGNVQIDKFRFNTDDNKYLSRFSADKIMFFINEKRILFKENVYAKIEEVD